MTTPDTTGYRVVHRGLRIGAGQLEIGPTAALGASLDVAVA